MWLVGSLDTCSLLIGRRLLLPFIWLVIITRCSARDSHVASVTAHAVFEVLVQHLPTWITQTPRAQASKRKDNVYREPQRDAQTTNRRLITCACIYEIRSA